MGSPLKKIRLAQDAAAMALKKIGTHSGSFHADEALACFMLKHTNEFSNSEIIRSRDEELLKTLDILVDVGAEYDPARLRFDHHQRGFATTFSPKHTIKLSSAGLIYLHYGKEVIQSIVQLPIDHPNMETVFQKVYTNLIEAMDGVDNGVEQYPSDAVPRYVNHTNIGSRVARLNPAWNETVAPEEIQNRFYKAMEATGEELVDCIKYVNNIWLPARDIIKNSLQARFSVHESGLIVKLEQFCPWKEHLFELEAELGLTNESEKPLYILYSEGTGAKLNWRIQAVPPKVDTFECRKALPQAWRGVRDAELSTLSGIPNCIFVHASGFIGGNQTYEGALEMARQSLTLA